MKVGAKAIGYVIYDRVEKHGLILTDIIDIARSNCRQLFDPDLEYHQ